MLGLAVRGISLLLAIWIWNRRGTEQESTNRAPRVPYWIPYFGHAFALTCNSRALLGRCRVQYGPIFRLYVAGKYMTFIVDPLYFRETHRHRTLSMDPITDDICLILGARKVHVDMMDNAKLHNIFVEHLSGAKALDSLLQSTFRVLDNELDKLPAGTHSLPLFTFVSDVIFATGTRVIFGDEAHSEHVQSAMKRFDANFSRMIAGVPSWLIPEGFKARDMLIAVLGELVGEVSATKSALIAAREKFIVEAMVGEDRSVTAQVVGSFNVGLLWAANANSIPTTYWLMYQLMRDEGAWKEICEEVNGVVHEGEWTRDDLTKMVKLDSAINEVLRLWGSPLSLRMALENTTIKYSTGKTFSFVKGEEVAIFASLAHVDPALFPHPLAFKFDRFLKDTEYRVPAFAFNPFGGGQSMCPGRNVAKFEVKAFVVCCVSRMTGMKLLCNGAAPVPDQTRFGLGILPPTSDHVELQFNIGKHERSPT